MESPDMTGQQSCATRKKHIMGHVWATVKYKYCQNCKKAYIKSHLEKDNCMYCNQPCEIVDVKRNGLYYAGNLVMIAGATVTLAPRLTTLPGSIFYLITGILILIAGIVLVMKGGVRMAQTAVNMGSLKDTDDEEDQ